MKMLLMLFGLLFSLSVFPQKTVRYSYDAMGNRVKRQIVLRMSDDAGDFPQMEKQARPDFYSDMLLEKQIRIYPNPTEGHLKVEISGLGDGSRARFRVTSMGGNIVADHESSNSVTELDLSRCTNGVYLLNIVLDGQESTWKIIKK